MRHVALLLALEGVAFWPVWQWLWDRGAAGGDDLRTLLPLLLALAAASTSGTLDSARRVPYGVLALMLLAYGTAAIGSGPVLRAALAFATLAVTALPLCRPSLASIGLLLLALPASVTVQFYLGWPLRIASATLAAALLRVEGFAVVRSGTGLLWDSHSVEVDAPCSGARMLWFGVLLALGIAGIRRLPARPTLALLGAAVATVVAGNALRAAALFLAFVHDALKTQLEAAVGGVVFALVGLCIAGLATRVSRPRRVGQ